MKTAGQQLRDQGGRRIVARLLVKRFGRLPEGVSQRLESASTAQLERWSDRLLDAATLDEVFAAPRRGRRAARRRRAGTRPAPAE